MKFNASWITTEVFKNLKPIDLTRKDNNTARVKSATENYHVHFIKTFQVSKNKKYSIMISADDYYKLYINGKFVCQGPAAAYADNYNYNQVDISEYINDGENVIAVHVYYNGLINRAWNSGDNRMGLIADVFCDSKFIFGTDETWLCERAYEYSGNTTEYCTQFREDIDFLRKNKNWKTDIKSGEYVPSSLVEYADWKFSDEPLPVVETYDVYPIESREIKNDGVNTKYSVLFDFGHEITGTVKLTAKGKRGNLICIKCGEELNEDKSVMFITRCNCKYYDVCTLSGDEDIFEFFDYKAFRYVQIDCDSLQTELMNVSTEVRHHHFNERLELVTDVPNLNEIWDICKNGIKCCVQEGYLDCPSREKGQYLGDFTVSGLAHLYLTDDVAMYKKALLDFAHSVKFCDGMLAVAPGSTKQEIADFSLQYPIQVMNLYKYTKDKEILKTFYPIISNIIEYFEKYENDKGLIENLIDKWNIVDWPMNLRDGYCIKTDKRPDKIPVHNVLNSYYIGAVQALEEIQRELGLTVKNKSSKLKKAFLDTFYDGEKMCFFDDEKHTHSALHSNVLPVYFNIAPTQAFGKIKRIIMEKGFACGVQFSYFVLKALARMGAYKEEFELLMNESEHSWVNMLREGATACFEAWGKDQKWNTSLCHAWASAPIIALTEDIVKVDFNSKETSGFEQIIIKDDKEYNIKLNLKQRRE